MLVRISSADNSKVKLVRKLATKKGRDSESGFVAEGVNLVSVLKDKGHDIDFIMLSENFLRDETNPRKQNILAWIEDRRIEACVVDERIFSALSDAEHGIDVLAVVRNKKTGKDYIEKLSHGDNILVCDRIQDPGNMGMMIRTAVAAGYAAIIAMPGTVDVYSPKVLRSTAGMVFEIPIVYADSEEDLFYLRDKTHRKIAVTVPTGGSEYYLCDLTGGVLLVIGNEGSGVSTSIMERADMKVTIPMRGNIESLNAAAAATILMYENVRKDR